MGSARCSGASAIGHIVLVGAFVFLPAWWFGAENKPPETIMQISLGGPIGPNDGGVATLGGRTIQQVVPVEAKKPIEPVRPPSAKTPEMVEPTKAPPRKTTPNKVEAKDPRSTKPTIGKEIQKGTSIAETGAKGMGFGLSSGGGGGGGHLEVSNFCCPEYLATMAALIKIELEQPDRRAGTDALEVRDPEGRAHRRHHRRTIERRRSDGFVRAARLDPDEAAAAAARLFRARRSPFTCTSITRAEKTR